jgi:hypothetical protein
VTSIYSIAQTDLDARIAGAPATTGDTALGCRRDSLREGILVGLIAATGIWVWIAMVDAIAGEPFHTFMVLGGLVLFTVMHFLLNAIYGVVIVSAMHGAARAPSLIIGLVFGFIILEIAVAMATVLLSNLGLGDLAWVRIFGGSLVGAAVAFVLLSRRHAFFVHLHQAEHER